MASQDRARNLGRRSVLIGALGVVGTGAFAGCGRTETAEHPRLRMATGPPGAVYREIGAALADELRSALPETDVEVLESRASTDNLRMLTGNSAEIGICSLDAVPFELGGVSALCRLYDSYLHLLVPAESDIGSLTDLEGRLVSFGATDSGTEYTVTRLADTAGVDMEGVRLDQAESAEALEDGSIDAMFSLTGIPTPAISALATRRSLRPLDLGEVADDMAETYSDMYYPATLPATAYEGIPASPTVSVPNVLLAREDLPEDVAALVTGTVFTKSTEIASHRPEAEQINVRTGIATGKAPMHPGAERWFRDQKI